MQFPNLCIHCPLPVLPPTPAPRVPSYPKQQPLTEVSSSTSYSALLLTKLPTTTVAAEYEHDAQQLLFYNQLLTEGIREQIALHLALQFPQHYLMWLKAKAFN